jgi:FkbM family methyltransferase
MVKSLLARVVRAVPTPVIKAVSHAQWRHPLLKRWFDWCASLIRGQDGVIQRGVGKGLVFNPGSANAGYLLGTSEPAVQQIFQKLVRPGMVVYDVGANVGFYTVGAARLTGPSGRVLAFEPVLRNFVQLQRNAHLNGFDHVAAWNIALADSDGTALFNNSPNPTWGRLASVDGEGTANNEKTTVTVARLDSIVEREALPLPDLIKIDVEGAEAAVLDGATGVLSKARPILLIELHGTNVAISERLIANGYFTAVLGTSRSVTESPWDAYVVAFPTPCAELSQIQNPHLGPR